MVEASLLTVATFSSFLDLGVRGGKEFGVFVVLGGTELGIRSVVLVFWGVIVVDCWMVGAVGEAGWGQCRGRKAFNVAFFCSCSIRCLQHFAKAAC